ncbi:GDSL-type esterase/lipase family protein, partial [Acidobacteriota bacterium]
LSRCFTLFAVLSATFFLSSSVRGQTTRIVCFGDSITAGVNLDDRNTPLRTPNSGYLPHLAKFLDARWQEVTLVNQGVPGMKSFEARNSINNVLGSNGYDYILIHIGANDVTRILSGEMSVGDTLGNLDYITAVANSRPNLTPVISTLLPRSYGPEEDTVRRINSGIKNIANAQNVLLADTYGHFRSNSSLGLLSDPLHPNLTGYQVMAEEWAATISGIPVGNIDLVSPIIDLIEPAPGLTNVSPLPEIKVRFFESGASVNEESIDLRINGESVLHQLKPAGSKQTISYVPTTVFSFNENVSVVVEITDTANPFNTTERRFSFKISSGNGTRGDINNSGTVDGVDLILLGSAFGSRWGDPSYSSMADFDENYVIDGVDLAVLANYFAR